MTSAQGYAPLFEPLESWSGLEAVLLDSFNTFVREFFFLFTKLGFGRSWGGPGAVLVRSWADVGWSWRILGGLGAILGRSWAVLGRLGAIVGRSWRGLGLGDLGTILGEPCALLGRS